MSVTVAIKEYVNKVQQWQCSSDSCSDSYSILQSSCNILWGEEYRNFTVRNF